jgi:hypothetical protein
VLWLIAHFTQKVLSEHHEIKAKDPNAKLPASVSRDETNELDEGAEDSDHKVAIGSADDEEDLEDDSGDEKAPASAKASGPAAGAARVASSATGTAGSGPESGAAATQNHARRPSMQSERGASTAAPAAAAAVPEPIAPFAMPSPSPQLQTQSQASPASVESKNPDMALSRTVKDIMHLTNTSLTTASVAASALSPPHAALPRRVLPPPQSSEAAAQLTEPPPTQLPPPRSGKASPNVAAHAHAAEGPLDALFRKYGLKAQLAMLLFINILVAIHEWKVLLFWLNTFGCLYIVYSRMHSKDSAAPSMAGEASKHRGNQAPSTISGFLQATAASAEGRSNDPRGVPHSLAAAGASSSAQAHRAAAQRSTGEGAHEEKKGEENLSASEAAAEQGHEAHQHRHHHHHGSRHRRKSSREGSADGDAPAARRDDVGDEDQDSSTAPGASSGADVIQGERNARLAAPEAALSAGGLLPAGRTFPKEREGTVHSWIEADATTFRLRIGPDYAKNKLKDYSLPSLCELMGMDVFRCPTKVSHIGKDVDVSPILVPSTRGGSPFANAADLKLDAELDSEARLGMPPVFIVHLKIPDYAPPNPVWGAAKSDGEGWGMTMYFTLKDETRRELLKSSDAERANAVTLLRNFVNAAADSPLRKRFKGIARVENLEELNLSSMVKRLVSSYNGTPFLIRTTSTFFRGPNYFEVDVDVHCFSYMALVGLNGMKDHVRDVVFDFVFVVEGHPDEELPEQMLGGARICRMDTARMDVYPK